MQRVLLFIDKLSMWVGHSFAWCILILTFATSYEVFVRYALRDPTAWAFDVSYIMYGTLFMMGGAYTLSRNGHVRGDVLYRLWPPRVQASIELTLYFLFFFPAMFALIYAGYDFAALAWRFKEASINSPIGVPVYPLKMIIPIAGLLLFLQGIAQTIRCVICIRNGAWPPVLRDVEELEIELMRQQQQQQQAGSAAAAEGGPK